jgi:hypothetical protein
MKYNNYAWSMILTYIHTNKDLEEQFVLVHNKQKDIMFVYDIYNSKKRKVEYIFELKNDLKLLNAIRRRGQKGKK